MNHELVADPTRFPSAGGGPRIVDVATKYSTVSQDLRYDSVVAINLGESEVALVDDGEVKSNARLVASNHEFRHSSRLYWRRRHSSRYSAGARGHRCVYR